MMNEWSYEGLMNRRDFLMTGLAAGALSLGGLASLSTLSACSVGVEGAVVIPTKPLAGHWGMVVDVQLFNERRIAQKVVEACHKPHNVPNIDIPRFEVKWIWQDDFEHCFAGMDNEFLTSRVKELKFPVLCNHCQQPACVLNCPTKATFQRPDGIVDMDYHRCIGCRFCMTACPYGARSHNFLDPRAFLEEVNPKYPTRTDGVVEKCNFCVERLSVGLKPYCVEASEGAILFGDLDDPQSEVRKALEQRLSIRRLAELGTEPSVYYLLRDGEAHV